MRARGSENRSSAPPPGALLASTVPPCASATWRTIASPRLAPGRPRARVPNAIEDHRAREHLPHVAHEQFEQLKLPAGQLHATLATKYLVPARVESQVRELSRLAAVPQAGSPQERAHSRT